MASSPQDTSNRSIAKVLLGSALFAVLASFALTRVLGSGSVETDADAAARLARSGLATAAPTHVATASQAVGQSSGAASGLGLVTPAAAASPPRYLDGVWNELHFKPAIDKATNEQCLSCHKDILDHKVRPAAPAGVKAAESLAWYQTLDTYAGDQSTFHARHMTSDFAKQVMNLKCNFCHVGHDPREEAPGSSATTVSVGNSTLRKQINPSESCLMCHGKFPAEIMGLEGSWNDLRESLESADTPNGCLTCHAEQFRTERHKVNYLKADAIEKLAKEGSSDVCLGCHGGRAWYRNSYPYPRHPWKGMPDEKPDWAANRPTQSAPEHRADTK